MQMAARGLSQGYGTAHHPSLGSIVIFPSFSRRPASTHPTSLFQVGEPNVPDPGPCYAI
ncbi:hypothetical protein BD779DRAFT_1571506 [Infundibulicybe gibba]|nr:hypothetical protein BD779DRAFT_1571506 [Infundibulicybe gibba]